MSPMIIMMSSNLVDILGGIFAMLTHVVGWRSPRRANILLQDVAFSLEGANVTLKGAWHLSLSLLGFNFEHLM
jgi:hypothetical protein